MYNINDIKKDNNKDIINYINDNVKDKTVKENIIKIINSKDKVINSNKEYNKNLMKTIKDKNNQIDFWHSIYDKVVFSRSFKIMSVLRKTLRIPANILRKVKRGIVGLFNQNKSNIINNHYSNYNSYISNYEDDIDFSNYNTDIKTIAFYLPQYHTFKENDEWWGKGFTEWTNAKKSVPRFTNHYQPRLPHDDIGFYDLSDYKTLIKQAKLAKKHGIYGFAIYYYWFSGKRLMEKPLDLLLKHKEIDINFCMCWANENWTRKWDGKNSEVLIAQKNSKDDPENFIDSLIDYINDERYIKIDNKPLIMIYNPQIIPDYDNFIKRCRKQALKNGIGEIVIWSRRLLNKEEIISKESDAEFDFPPLEKGFKESIITGIDDAYLFDYSKIVDEMIKLYDKNDDPNYIYGSTMGWDNSSRRKSGYVILDHYSSYDFYRWNSAIIEKLHKEKDINHRYMLVNAWNEWCEGTYLEPDQKFGYKNINTLSKAIYGIPYNKIEVSNANDSILYDNKNKKRIAVQIHLFYPDLCSEIIDNLNYIPYDFDCFITTSDEDKKNEIIEKFKKCNAKKVVVDITENRGRDVAPFIIQMSEYIKDYDYICHIHTKKSKTVQYGDLWRKYLYKNLFGSKENLIKIFDIFEKEKDVGVIYPEIYPVLKLQTGFYGDNLSNCIKLFNMLGIPETYINDRLDFPAGTMFWAKTDAIHQLFTSDISFSDFAVENNQLDATLAHAIERSICTIAKYNNYCFKNIYNDAISSKLIECNRTVIYCNCDNVMSDADYKYLDALKEISKDMVFISNTWISDKDMNEIKKYTNNIIISDSDNYIDMWKSYLIKNNSNNTDQYIITNNKVLYTNIELNEFLNESIKNDVYSIGYMNTLDDTENKNYKVILDLFTINSKFVKSEDFQLLIRNNSDYIENNFYENICNYSFDVYVKETEFISKYIVNNPLYLFDPYSMVLFKSPIVNKDSLLFASQEEYNAIICIIDEMKG